MKESEASTILKAEIVHHPECSIFAEALGLAIQALEKQIPKKPFAHQCTTCGSAVLPFDGSCCSNCGQKLDWSDEE